MSNYNAFLLKTAREQSGLSQGGFAKALGINQALLSKYERNTLVPPLQMQEKIAQLLHYPVSFFFATGRGYSVRTNISS